MTLDEAIKATRAKVMEDPQAEMPFLEEMQACAQAREIAARHAMLAAMGIGKLDPATAYLAAFALGVEVGKALGAANAETATLEKLFDKAGE